MKRINHRRIGIDARFYGPIGKGLGRYVERLILHLERLESDLEFVIFLRAENWNVYNPSSPRFTKARAPFAWYSLDEQVRYPLLLAKHRLDLVHFPHFNVPLWYRGKFIVTIHDLILTKFPTERASTLGPTVYRIKHAASQFVLQSAVRRAARVVTVSNFSKQQIQETLGVPGDRISVMYEGCEPLAPETAVEPPRYGPGWPERFVLYVGNAYPHKNLETLLAAWELIRKRGRSESLVLVGKPDYFFNRLRQQVLDSGLDRGKAPVIFPGYVTDGQLRWLYRRAGAYVFPSLMEGFGLPGLEAMSEGTPVLAANASSLPEIFGNAAAYFRPHDPKNIADQIETVLDSDSVRGQLIDRGRKRAQQYRWETMARQTLALYEELV